MSGSREAFEKAVRNDWSDSFGFRRNRSGDYIDEITWGMWWSWQASRQAIEGDPTAIVNESGILQWYPPYNRPPAGTRLYAHISSRQEFDSCEPAASVPSVLYDGYAVLQEVRRARAELGSEEVISLQMTVSDVLDAAVKLIKQEYF